MNPWLWQTLVQCLGWTLLHFLWQGLAIAVLLAVALRLLRSAPAQYRYLAGCLALLAMAAAPVITFYLVAKPDQPPPPAKVTGTVSTPAPNEAPYVVSVPFVSSPAPKPNVASSIKTTPPSTKALAKLPAPITLTFSQRLDLLLPWLVIGWLLGVAALSSRLFLGWLQIKRLQRRADESVADALLTQLDVLADRLGIHRPLRLLQSAWVEVPTVIGWLRPVILLPASCLTGLTPAQLEAILAHELAHIRRHDYLVNLLQSAVETLLFYHPAVWWVSRRIREERENCCDDLAVKVCGDPVVYARALATLEELRPAPAQLALAAAGSPLVQRIHRLLQQPARNPARPARPAWPLAGITTLALVGLLACIFQSPTASSADANYKPDHVVNVGRVPPPGAAPIAQSTLPNLPTQSDLLPRPATKEWGNDLLYAPQLPTVGRVPSPGVPSTFQSGQEYSGLTSGRDTHNDHAATNDHGASLPALQAQTGDTLASVADQAPLRRSVAAVQRQSVAVAQIAQKLHDLTDATGLNEDHLHLLEKVNGTEAEIERQLALLSLGRALFGLGAAGSRLNQLPVNESVIEQAREALAHVGEARPGVAPALSPTLLAQKSDAVTTAADEAIRREAYTVQLRQTLSAAQNAQKHNDLPKATRLYENCWQLVQKVGGTAIDRERKAVVTGLTAVLFDLAGQDQKLRMYDQADEKYRRILNIDPGNQTVRLSQIQNKQLLDEQYRTTETPFPPARIPTLTSNVQSAATHVQNGKLLFEAGELDRAEVELHHALDADPDNVAANHYLALVAEKRMSLAVSAAQSRRGFVQSDEINLDPVSNTLKRIQQRNAASGKAVDNAPIHVQNGELLYEAGKLDEAEVQLHLALAEDPTNLTASHYLALVAEKRMSLAVPQTDEDARKALAQVQKEWDVPQPNRELAPRPNQFARTNLAHTSPGRSAMIDNLNRIKINSVKWQGLPLKDVLDSLSDLAKSRDPNQKGINFFISKEVAPNQAAAVDQNGLPQAPTIPEEDISDVSITLIRNTVTLSELLDAITKTADRPIKYSILDYAIVFSARTGDPLEVRTFHIDPNTFEQSLQSVSSIPFGRGQTTDGYRISMGGGIQDANGPHGVDNRAPKYVTDGESNVTNLASVVRQFFLVAGIDLNTNSGKAVVWNDRRGTLTVRATAADLDMIATVISTINQSPPAIKVKSPDSQPTDSPAPVSPRLPPQLTNSPVASSAQPGSGRQNVLNKLNRIRIDSAKYGDVPLKEVLEDLTDKTRAADPDGTGISFLSGEESARPNGRSVRDVRVRIDVAAKSIRLIDLLGLMLTPAETPLEYSVLDQGVVFSLRNENEPMPLEIRIFHVDSEAFIKRLENLPGISPSIRAGSPYGELQSAVRQLLISAGAALDTNKPANSGKAVFFSENNGMLTVRATAGDFNKVTSFVQAINRELVQNPSASVATMENYQVDPSWNGVHASRREDPEPLETRTIHVDPNTFLRALNLATDGTGTNRDQKIGEALRQFLKAAGLELRAANAANDGKALLFWNDRRGTLTVRATRQDLDFIAAIMASLNTVPPQVDIKVKIVSFIADTNVPTPRVPSVPEGIVASGLRMTTAAPVVPSFTCILTDGQFRLVTNALEQRTNTEIWTAPELTTEAGREVQISQESSVPSLVTNLPSTPSLHMVAKVSADQYTIRMDIVSTVGDFLGYEDPGQVVVQAQLSGRKAANPVLPLPHFHLRQITNTTTVWDGETLVIGGMTTDAPLRTTRTAATTANAPIVKKNLMVFITPTLINPDGTRYHSDDEMPLVNSMRDLSGKPDVIHTNEPAK